MAAKMKIFSIYKVSTVDKYYLLRTERPSFSNANQNEEDLAINVEQSKRVFMLKQIEQKHNLATLDLIGELQGFPVGDIFYSNSVSIESAELTIFYMESEFGKPWIILGNAATELDFLKEVNEDEDLLSLNPLGKPIQITATFISEDNFDFSKIEPKS